MRKGVHVLTPNWCACWRYRKSRYSRLGKITGHTEPAYADNRLLRLRQFVLDTWHIIKRTQYIARTVDNL